MDEIKDSIVNIEKSRWNIFKLIWNFIWLQIKKSCCRLVKEPLLYSRNLIFIVALGHLCMLTTHIRCLYVIVNQYSGFLFFFYILLGLIALFNAVRLKSAQGRSWILSLVVLALTIICGTVLIYIYMDCYSNQTNLPARSKPYVMNATILSAACALIYIFAFVQLIRAKFKKN